MEAAQIENLNTQFEKATPQAVLQYFINNYKGEIVLASSLGAEDQALTKMVCDIDKSTRIFTLDTGRLFPETYNLISDTKAFFDINIEVYFPSPQLVEPMVKQKGINLFYNSIENRKQCCHARKLEPLKRAFAGAKVWICGLRKDQSITRFFNKTVEWDSDNNMLKINPLLNWTEKQVWEYVKTNNIPYNILHDKGFPSIGCQPCTRAIEKGEDVRAGRWWWEQPEQKECGLHNRK